MFFFTLGCLVILHFFGLGGVVHLENLWVYLWVQSHHILKMFLAPTLGNLEESSDQPWLQRIAKHIFLVGVQECNCCLPLWRWEQNLFVGEKNLGSTWDLVCAQWKLLQKGVAWFIVPHRVNQNHSARLKTNFVQHMIQCRPRSICPHGSSLTELAPIIPKCSVFFPTKKWLGVIFEIDKQIHFDASGVYSK